jgi:flagellar basal body-associated protein FliL
MFLKHTKRGSRKINGLLTILIVIAGLIYLASPFVLAPDFAVRQYFQENSARAFDFSKTLDNTAQRVGLSLPYSKDSGKVADLPELIGKILLNVLGMVGVIFFVLVIIAGFQWMIAGGGEEQVGAAKKRLKNAVIGVAIVIMAYAITSFIVNLVIKSTSGTGQSVGSCCTVQITPDQNKYSITENYSGLSWQGCNDICQYKNVDATCVVLTNSCPANPI